MSSASARADAHRASANRAAVGHADLLRLLQRADRPVDPDAVALLAQLTGLRAPPPEDEPVTAAPETPAPDAPTAPATKDIAIMEGPAWAPSPQLPASPSQTPLNRMPWHVTGWAPIRREGTTPGAPPDWWRSASPLADDLPGDDQARPRPEALTPWRRLWPFLRAALGAYRDGHALDLRRLVTLAACGQIPRRLPRRRRQHWATRARLVLDLSPHLAPVHRDLQGLIDPLRRLRGPVGLELLLTNRGADGPWQCLDAQNRWAWVTRPASLDDATTPVLVVSDLGCCAGSAERAAWVRLGRKLGRTGNRPVVLLTCPPRFWHPELTGLFHPVDWDRHRRLPNRIPRVPRCNLSPPELTKDPGGNRLLDLLSPLVRLEPELMRALRLQLGGPDQDLGAELAAWNHPDLVPTLTAREWIDRNAITRRQSGWRQYDTRSQRIAAELSRDCHRHLARSIQAEEIGNLARLLGRNAPRADDYLAQMARTLGKDGEADLTQRLRKQAKRLGARQPAAAWADTRRGALWVLANRAQLLETDGNCDIPPGLDLSRFDWLFVDGTPPRVFTVMQLGAALCLAPKYDGILPTQELRGASPLTWLSLSAAPVLYRSLAEGQQTPIAWSTCPPDASARIPFNGRGLRLRGHDAEVTIEPLSRPDWASDMGQDDAGVWCDVSTNQGTRRLRWMPPGPLLDPDAHQSVRAIPIPHGAWWDESTWRAWRKGKIVRPTWAKRSGMDDAGIWAEFEVLKPGTEPVIQRLRWLWPREFLMGSPEQECGRFQDEQQRSVMLSRGCWLADTACTWELWWSALGERLGWYHLSRIDSPVTKTSFEDIVSRFLPALNSLVPGLDARLPSEAEWEYGCRAGTDTPFWFEGRIDPGLVNYKGDSPHSDSTTVFSRNTTVRVKALPANGWGLYQMHGNVWEWCQDRFDKYPHGRFAEDYCSTGELRVIRGGSFKSSAEHCRAARRHHWDSKTPRDDLGFLQCRHKAHPPRRPVLSCTPTRGQGATRRAVSSLPAGVSQYVLHHGRFHA
jgi:hypothetical protein